MKITSTSISLSFSTRSGKPAPRSCRGEDVNPSQRSVTSHTLLWFLMSYSPSWAEPSKIISRKNIRNFALFLYRCNLKFWEDTVTLWAPAISALKTPKYFHALVTEQWSSGYFWTQQQFKKNLEIKQGMLYRQDWLDNQGAFWRCFTEV